ncbi:MAG TPA: HAD family hydrolase [Acidimicrobiales bacterium]
MSTIAQTVIFDGDDTLWETEVLYDRARTAARELIEQMGFDGERWEALQRIIDVQNVDLLGLSAIRFPTSCREAYESVCREDGTSFDTAVARAIYEAADTVFESTAPIYPDSLPVLESLSGKWRLMLLTRGDQKVQRRRIDESGLAQFFEEIRVVDEKTTASWAALISDCGIDVSASWSVGNSIGSDITPAIECGLWAAWIPAHVWEREQHDGEPPASRRMRKLQALGELPDLLRDQLA